MNNIKIFIDANNKNEFTNDIQIAIDECSNKLGGKIILNTGIHKSLPIILKSNIELHLEDEAILLFSDNFSDYESVFTRWEGTECHALRSMIFAVNCTDVKITGAGTIDGLGMKWWAEYKNIRNGILSSEVIKVQNLLRPLNANIDAGSGGGGIDTDFLRPSLIQIKNCNNVLIEGVTLKDSAFWNTHILYSDNIRLKKVIFESPNDAPNTDGLDIDSSSFIDVTDCHFDVGDDCLCLKSGMDADGIRVGKSTHDVRISGCSMFSGHGGIVIGSETSGGIHDIDIRDCVMAGTDRGIRVKTRRKRGGTIKNINIDNLKMDNVICPLVMNMYYRCGASKDQVEYLKSTDEKEFIQDATPVIENISVSNIIATNIRSSAAFFYGLPESYIKNLTLRNFNIKTDSELSKSTPAMDFFDTQPENDIFLKNISGFKSSNIKINNSFIRICND
ncbi:MAG: glycoside hydrolase family 28 protein [Spirochaetaceae bacterium]